MMPPTELAAARIEADAAKQRLLADAHALQVRLNPGRLANHAMQDVKARGEEGAREAMAFARRRPAIAAGAGVAVAALILRRPIASLFRRLRGKPDTTDVETSS